MISELVAQLRAARPSARRRQHPRLLDLEARGLQVSVTDGGSGTRPRTRARLLLRARRPGHGDRRDARPGLVDRAHRLAHDRARPAARLSLPATGRRPRCVGSRPWVRSRASRHGRTSRRTVAGRRRGRPAPAVPVRVGPPLQGLPRQRRRPGARRTSPGRSRASPASATWSRCARSSPPRPRRCTLRTASPTAGPCSCARCCRWPRRRWSATDGAIWLGLQVQHASATRAATSPPCCSRRSTAEPGPASSG